MPTRQHLVPLQETMMKTAVRKMALNLVIALLPLAVNAQGTTPIGNWNVNTSLNGLHIAATSNEAGSVAGILCGIEAQKCEAYISIDSSGCEIGQAYPMMLNSSIGSFSITTKCMAIGTARFQFANEFSSMRQAFESGGEIGFALPLKNGQFNVISFSTAGATAAIKEAMTLPDAPQKPRNGEGATL